MFDLVFDRFVKDAPFAVMLRASLEHLFANSFLDDLFQKHAQVQYQRELTFSAVTSLLSQVVLRVHPSVRAAYRKRLDWPVTLKAVYEKLQGVEPVLCQALVQQTAQRCQHVLDHYPEARQPDPIPGLRLRVLDGNFLAGTEHRLKPLRQHGAAALPGMTVVMRDGRTGLLSRLLAREDAYTNERSLFEEVLSWIEADDLVLADRNYCTLDWLVGIAKRDAFFVIRHHKQLHLHPQEELRHVGTTATGEVYEQLVRVGEGKRALELRCVVIKLFEPTTEGETEVVLLSNVAAERAAATLLATLYLQRWTIERTFQELTEYLRCEIKTLAYPKAALFGFSLAVAAYNVLAVLRGAVAASHGRERVDQELSFHAVASEIASDSSGLRIALPAENWLVFGSMSSAALASWLRGVAQGIRWERYRKSKRGPKKPVQIQRSTRGAHRSTARLLEKQRK